IGGIVDEPEGAQGSDLDRQLDLEVRDRLMRGFDDPLQFLGRSIDEEDRHEREDDEQAERDEDEEQRESRQSHPHGAVALSLPFGSPFLFHVHLRGAFAPDPKRGKLGSIPEGVTRERRKWTHPSAIRRLSNTNSEKL